MSAVEVAVVVLCVVFLVLTKRLCSLKWFATVSETLVRKPESVNYHFTRQCNYACGFCFHTAKTSFVLPEAEAKMGLKLLKEAGEIND